MHLGSLESSQEARVVSFFSVSFQQRIARDSHRLVSTYSITSRNMLLSCRCHFEINRNPQQSDKFSGHISLPGILTSALACSQTLYFLFKILRARVIKYKPQGIYWLPAQGGSGGGRRRKWTVCRHLWEQLKLAFPRKSKLPLAERRLSCHHHVNDSSRSRHASRSVCNCLDSLNATLIILIVICTKKITSIESAADFWTWDGVVLIIIISCIGL